jgi:hypothetical protein
MDDQTNTRSEGMGGLWPPRQDTLSAPSAAPVSDIEEMKRITNLLDHIDSGSQVRRVAEEILNRNSGEIDSLTPVIQPLIRPNRSSWRKRQVAAWILGVAKLDRQQRQFAVESLVKLLEGKLDPDVNSVLRDGTKRSLILSALLTLPVKSQFYPYGDLSTLGVFLQLLICLAPIMLLGSAIHNKITSRYVAAETARALGNLHATEALGVVVTAAQSGLRRRPGGGKRRVRQAAQQALPSILRPLTEDHYGTIRSETMQGLVRLLQAGDETLAVAILIAFAQIGDSTVLAAVERLAGGGGRAAAEPRVYNAALVALPLIQVRVARARDPHQLLRGSSMPMTPTDQLLRPSTETSITDPLELLRASADPNWKGTEEEVGFVIRILQHLQQNGDTRALTYVEQIADCPTADVRIRNAATECLPVLRAHRELERYSPRPTESQPNILGLRQNL